MKFLVYGLILLALCAANATGQAPLATTDGIRQEATRKNDNPMGRPLPLVGHWNLGEVKNGFGPDYQMEMIDKGHHFLPWFLMPNIYADPTDPHWIAYYEQAFRRAAQLHLPIALISTQWESMLAVEENFVNLPANENPNVVMSNGSVRREVSPFGPVNAWREVGTKWASSAMMKKLQEWYPDPPLILLISNNEQAKLNWTKAAEDRRFTRLFGENRDDEFKRKVVGDAWILRYRAMQESMRESFVSPIWKDRSIFVGYDAFGPAHFGRWAGWMEYSLYSKNRVDPWPLAWDGGSPSFYVYNWSAMTDYTVFSPQVETMNWVFMQAEARKYNPNFWFEMSVWDGHEPTMSNDKWKAYGLVGQKYTTARYAGMTQFGMWLLRPRVVREFRGYQGTLAEFEPYFLPVVAAVDRVHRNPVLRDFWRKGTLVPNRAGSHPYQTIIPDEYKNADRWFLLETSVDPPRPWNLETQLPVFSLALVMGNAPRRQWLVYAHGPIGPRNNVKVTIPGYRAITINISQGGSFYTVDEATGVVQPVTDPK